MKRHITTLQEFIDLEYGLKGTRKRERFEKGYKKFLMEEVLPQQLTPISSCHDFRN
jgi:hypothetical protein